MSKLQAYRCDSCGDTVLEDMRTIKKVKLIGDQIFGEYEQDLCPECVGIPDGVTLKPLRTRRVAVRNVTGSAVEVPSG